MLNEELCDLLGVDKFKRFLIKELEDIETLNELNAFQNGELKNYVTTRYSILKEVLDVYCRLNSFRYNKNKYLSLDEVVTRQQLFNLLKDLEYSI